jgi:hypothetical protein
VKASPGRFVSHHEVSAKMTEAKKMAKKTKGNFLFVEQRNAMGMAIAA